jgi:uncharacterized membrane protein
MQLGVSSGSAFFLLFASLLGSYVNIPIAALGQESVVTEREVTYFGMRYVVPMIVGSPHVILAVNVGGAVIPTLLSIYLLSKNRLWGRGLIATACVSAGSIPRRGRSPNIAYLILRPATRIRLFLTGRECCGSPFMERT